ncbi:unnamed protein product [Macrosiphum euphorbiae]|uniref:Reverse transcriptase n=1 Tax=Macrosiphum euphorbiae TaxID=13131 RepID=A0AAV0XRC5_9HEMI|nr:unnamed protein product [Macrosiphum euphorbiae]
MFRGAGVRRVPFRRIPSSDFKDYARIRINALPTRKRVNRGKAGPVRCRACGLVDETLGHISQTCQRTHESRIMRHDCLVKRITGGLREKRYEVETEHLYKLHGGNVKPDIVATISDETRGRISVICDVQVVSGSDPVTWHSNKLEKYNDRADLKNRDPHQTPIDRSTNGRCYADLAWRLGSRKFSGAQIAWFEPRSSRGARHASPPGDATQLVYV